nr:apolipoprotein N-acyltransferase [Spirulina major]
MFFLNSALMRSLSWPNSLQFLSIPSYPQLIFALLGGVFMGLTIAPVEAFPLAWIALIPLWIVTIRASRKMAIFAAIAWGFGYYGLALFWITGIHPMTWLGVPWLGSIAIALFCWLFITFWGTGLVVVWSILLPKTNHKKGLLSSLLRVLIGTSIWCVFETIWSYTPLWWSPLAYTQSPHNLIILHLGQISGTTAVTGAIVAVNGLLAEALILKEKKWQLTGIAIALLIGLHGLGLSFYNRPLLNQNPLRVGIIQGNIPNEIKLNPEGWYKAIEGYTSGYKELSDRGVDAVLTPETALPFVWQDRGQFTSSFYQAILEKGVLAWVGGFTQEDNKITNSLFTVTGAGKTVSHYDKVKLVPLGEYIPLQQILGKFINRLSPLEATLIPGKPTQIFETPFGRAIVGICYESAFSYHFQRQAAQGGEFILTASNNAHYSEVMPAQHHALDVMRAIENDRWAVRATNTGYSGIVDPHGKTLWRSGINTYELHDATIYRRTTKTLYVRWGDWLTWCFLGLGAIALFLNKTKIFD